MTSSGPIAPSVTRRFLGGGWDDWAERHWPLALALLAAATIAIRARYFGNPLVHVDEEFYLLVGDRMLGGALPYVDIWDRKPVGLFLLYAGIRLLGGEGIVQYQLVAAAFAAGTAVVVAAIARRIASPGAALAVAFAYVPALAMNGGQGGQAPVFYNLPVAGAALLVMGLFGGTARIRVVGAAAMALIGIAIQVKYTAVFEGFFFGVVLLFLAWRAGRSIAALATDALIWSGLALLPSLAAYDWYRSIGHGGDFLYANFFSIGQRGAVNPDKALADFGDILVHLAPLAVPLILGTAWRLRSRQRPWADRPDGTAVHRFALGWLGAALAGFASLGTFFDHYALPLLPPLAVLLAPCLTLRPRWVAAMLGAGALLGGLVPYPLEAASHEHTRGDAAYARRLAAMIAPHLGPGRCLYIFNGQPALYQLTHSCLPTRWPFPFHLALRREAPALGVDARRETARIMASAPAVVVDTLHRDIEINRDTERIVREELKRHYRLAFAYTHPRTGGFTDQIWVRR